MDVLGSAGRRKLALMTNLSFRPFAGKIPRADLETWSFKTRLKT